MLHSSVHSSSASLRRLLVCAFAAFVPLQLGGTRAACSLRLLQFLASLAQAAPALLLGLAQAALAAGGTCNLRRLPALHRACCAIANVAAACCAEKKQRWHNAHLHSAVQQAGTPQAERVHLSAAALAPAIMAQELQDLVQQHYDRTSMGTAPAQKLSDDLLKELHRYAATCCAMPPAAWRTSMGWVTTTSALTCT